MTTACLIINVGMISIPKFLQIRRQFLMRWQPLSRLMIAEPVIASIEGWTV